jgi:protein tyrosine phosphatase
VIILFVQLKIAGENWWYIAAQGPMDNTAQHFWQMVWEQEVEVIAMLTKLIVSELIVCAGCLNSLYSVSRSMASQSAFVTGQKQEALRTHSNLEM